MLFIQGLLSLILSTSFANPYGKRSGRWLSELKVDFLTTTENIDDNGDIVDLNSGYEFSETKYRLKLDYDYSEQTTLYSELSINSASSIDSSFERSDTSPSDLLLGFDYLLGKERLQWVPSFFVRIPLTTYDLNSDDALTNDKSMDFTGRIHMTSKWSSVFLQAYLGLTYRTEGLSMLLPFGAEVLYHTTRFSFGGGIKSFYSITDDEDTSNTTVRDNFLQTVNAGSQRYYSVNPSLTSAYGFLRFYIEPQLYIGGNFDQTLFGENTYYGTTYSAFLGYSFGGEKARRLPHLKPNKRKRTKKEFYYEFDNERDKDEDVFSNSKDFQYRESIDESLDKVEDSIEIKLKKKKKRRKKRKRN